MEFTNWTDQKPLLLFTEYSTLDHNARETIIFPGGVYGRHQAEKHGG
jgi:hypothetical protein